MVTSCTLRQVLYRKVQLGAAANPVIPFITRCIYETTRFRGCVLSPAFLAGCRTLTHGVLRALLVAARVSRDRGCRDGDAVRSCRRP